MSGNRTRGLLRAAALLAVGASPVLASAASAAEGPTDIVDGKFGHAPEVGVGATKPVTDLLSGQSVKLPAPLQDSELELRAPRIAAPAAVPAAPKVPSTDAFASQAGDLLAPEAGALLAAPQARALPAPQLPDLQQPVSAQQADIPELSTLPVKAPELG